MNNTPRIEGTPDPRDLGKLGQKDTVNADQFKKILRVDKSDESEQKNKRNLAKSEEEEEDAEQPDGLTTPQTLFSNLMKAPEKTTSVFDAKGGKTQTFTSAPNTEAAPDTFGKMAKGPLPSYNMTPQVEPTPHSPSSLTPTTKTNQKSGAQSQGASPPPGAQAEEGAPSAPATAPDTEGFPGFTNTPSPDAVPNVAPIPGIGPITPGSIATPGNIGNIGGSFTPTVNTTTSSTSSDQTTDQNNQTTTNPVSKTTKTSHESKDQSAEKKKKKPAASPAPTSKNIKKPEEAPSVPVAKPSKKPTPPPTNTENRSATLPKEAPSSIPIGKEPIVKSSESTPSASSSKKEEKAPLSIPIEGKKTPSLQTSATSSNDSISSLDKGRGISLENSNERDKDSGSDTNKKKEDSSDTSQQINTPPPQILPMGIAPTPTPAYASLSTPVFELFEHMVGLITIKDSTKGVSTTTITLTMPGSVFHGSEITLEHYDTAPHNFNVQFLGTPQAVQLFSANISQLATSFQQGNYSFSVNIQTPALLKKERPLFKRKEDIDNESGNSQEDF